MSAGQTDAWLGWAHRHGPWTFFLRHGLIHAGSDSAPGGRTCGLPGRAAQDWAPDAGSSYVWGRAAGSWFWLQWARKMGNNVPAELLSVAFPASCFSNPRQQLPLTPYQPKHNLQLALIRSPARPQCPGHQANTSLPREPSVNICQ